MFERCVGRKIEAVFSRNAGNGAGLLIAGENSFDTGEVEVGFKNAAFVAVVAGENPEAISPLVVSNVVNVADRAFRKCVGDLPGRAMVGRSVDMHFVAMRVVEIFSPIKLAVWSRGDVQRACAASDLWVTRNSDSPGARATIAPGAAATKCLDGRTASA